MFPIFVIFSGIIFTAGPGHNEGGFDAIAEKGLKPAIETAIDERELLDYSKLNG